MTEVGQFTESFTAVQTTGRPFDSTTFLADKRLLLLFYNNGHKGCCGDRLPSGVVSEMTESLRSLDTEPIGIAIGETLSPNAFLSTLDLPFPFLVDADGDIHRMFGAFLPESKHPNRHTVVIGRNGVVVYSHFGSPTPEELIELLNDLQDDPVTPVE